MFGVWRAAADGDQVVVRPDDQPNDRLLFPRLPIAGELTPGGSTYCAADFIKPAAALKAGESDYIGGYAIRLDEPIRELTGPLAAESDEYWPLLSIDLCALYRSAVADYLHYRLRRFIWAYCNDDDLSNEEVLTGLHQGIRVEVGGRECPDRAEQTKLLRLLGVDGWTLVGWTDSTDGPSSVVCGYFFAHPQSRNFPSEPAPGESIRPL